MAVSTCSLPYIPHTPSSSGIHAITPNSGRNPTQSHFPHSTLILSITIRWHVSWLTSKVISCYFIILYHIFYHVCEVMLWILWTGKLMVPFKWNGYSLSVLCGGCVLFVEDFSLSKCPSSNGRKFYVSAPRSSPGKVANSLPSSASSNSLTDERTSTRLRRKMRDLVVGEAKPKWALTFEMAKLLIHFNKTSPFA